MDLIERVDAYIRRYRLLEPGQRLVVGVSGGADSLTLLEALRTLGYCPLVAHLDHRLRGGSWQDALFVLHHASQRGLPAVVGRREVRQVRVPGQSLEEAAREVRYRFLMEVASEHRLAVVAVAHTADDQAETILMHLLRGAGPSGLRGMRPSSPLAEVAGVPGSSGLTLIRPLLCVTREETTGFCSANGLRPRVDPSNSNTEYFRNRLRLLLLPTLETYNPEVRSVLCRMGEIMAGEVEWTERAVDAAWPVVTRPAGNDAVVLLRRPFEVLPVGAQRAVFRRAVARLRPGLRDVGFEAVERGIHFVAGDRRSPREATAGGLELIDLGREVVLRLPDGAVTFPELPQLRTPRSMHLPIGRSTLAEGWSITVEQHRLKSTELVHLRRTKGSNEIAVDADRVRGGLQLRTAQPGDRIRVLGSPGTSKIADIFVNAHVPWLARRRWPLIVDRDRVVWVAGLKMAQDCRLTRQSRRAIFMRLIPPRRQEE